VNIYRQKSTWKIALVVSALLIMGASLWYSNELARDIAEREEEEAEMWAKAYRNIIQADENTDLTFELEVIQENENVPAILANHKDSILATRNIDVSKGYAYLQKRLQEMKSERESPIEIEISPGVKNYIYYEESIYIRKLKFYPFVQFGIISAFLAFAYVLLATARSAEQNQLWVGMAKETAHQLGTPLTSLAAWIELLKEKKTDSGTKEILDDVQKDIDRLELVADRFSKIGSPPEMKEEALKPLLEKCIDYMRKRTSESVKIELRCEVAPKVKLSPPLFEWVLENLLKNALDAMSGKGIIILMVSEDKEKILLDIKDSGKGILKSEFNTVFQPGYTTKKRGWGLGLTLSKRIIEQYHGGKIFVKESSQNSGTTFRLTLPKH